MITGATNFVAMLRLLNFSEDGGCEECFKMYSVFLKYSPELAIVKSPKDCRQHTINFLVSLYL